MKNLEADDTLDGFAHLGNCPESYAEELRMRLRRLTGDHVQVITTAPYRSHGQRVCQVWARGAATWLAVAMAFVNGSETGWLWCEEHGPAWLDRKLALDPVNDWEG